jgi:hypothetical protein
MYSSSARRSTPSCSSSNDVRHARMTGQSRRTIRGNASGPTCEIPVQTSGRDSAPREPGPFGYYDVVAAFRLRAVPDHATAPSATRPLMAFLTTEWNLSLRNVIGGRMPVSIKPISAMANFTGMGFVSTVSAAWIG